MVRKNCSKCSRDLPNEGDYVNCLGCNGLYHFECSISQSTYGGMGKKSRANWRCVTCRGGRRSAEDEVDIVDVSRDGSDIVLVKNKISSIESLLAIIQKSIDEIKDTQRLISTQYDEVLRAQEDTNKRLKCLESQISSDIARNVERDEKIESLSRKINDLEKLDNQYKFEIHGLIEEPNENVGQLVVKITEKLGIPISMDEIEHANRAKVKGKDGSCPIIVRLSTIRKRNAVLKERKREIWNSELIGRNVEGKVIIYECISPYYKKLLWEARSRAKIRNWKFVWVQNGNVLLRKSEGNRIVQVSGLGDLDKINW